jgi:hypothetical protein
MVCKYRIYTMTINECMGNPRKAALNPIFSPKISPSESDCILARAFRAIDVGQEEMTEHWYDQLFLVSHLGVQTAHTLRAP